MGMSTYVLGFRPPDETWHKMKKIYDACKEADVEVPQNVREFFDFDEPDEAGVEVGLKSTAALREWRDPNNDAAEGFEVILDNLPEHIKIIRFVNSY